MRYLLDTHVFLWLQASPDRIEAPLLRQLDRADALLLSGASAWEIGIKHALGKLTLPLPPRTYVPDRMATSGVDGIAVELPHALAAAELPPHHRDPFDRLLVAQSLALDVPLVTADRIFENYEADVIWV